MHSTAKPSRAGKGRDRVTHYWTFNNLLKYFLIMMIVDELLYSFIVIGVRRTVLLLRKAGSVF